MFANLVGFPIEIFIADEGEELDEACRSADFRMANDLLKFLPLLLEIGGGCRHVVAFKTHRKPRY
jgi:hypothetical protein